MRADAAPHASAPPPRLRSLLYAFLAAGLQLASHPAAPPSLRRTALGLQSSSVYRLLGEASRSCREGAFGPGTVLFNRTGAAYAGGDASLTAEAARHPPAKKGHNNTLQRLAARAAAPAAALAVVGALVATHPLWLEPLLLQPALQLLLRALQPMARALQPLLRALQPAAISAAAALRTAAVRAAGAGQRGALAAFKSLGAQARRLFPFPPVPLRAGGPTAVVSEAWLAPRHERLKFIEAVLGKTNVGALAASRSRAASLGAQARAAGLPRWEAMRP